MSSHTQRAFILGLDGLPWSLIEQWAGDGTLPNFARMLEEGAAGPLESTIPAATPLAWPSIATGVSPDKHGIYGFRSVMPDYTHQMNTSATLKRPPLWEILSPSIVANVPMTYPTREIDGTLVAGIMASEIDKTYTHPSSLAAEIRRDIPEYKIALKWSDYIGRTDALVEDITTQITARRKLLTKLMAQEDWELFFFTVMEPDRLQHLVWDEDVLREMYRRLDEILGDVLEYVAEHDANLFVISDHGFGPLSKQVGVNRILEQAGYLTQKESTPSRRALSKLGIDKTGLVNTVERVGIDHRTLVKKHLPQGVVDFVASTVPGDSALYDIDHRKTKAFVHSMGAIYVNDSQRFEEGIVDPSDVPDLKRELTELFAALRDPETGEQPLEVHDGDTLFPTDPQSPDLVLDPGEQYTFSSSLDAAQFGTPSAIAGHRPEGIFLAWGPDIGQGVQPRDASVLDVAPTVLHSLGRPVPEDTDGTVLHEIFAPDTPPDLQAVESKAYEMTGVEGADEDMAEVKERLQGLGYLE